jgi:hypothetical protein
MSKLPDLGITANVEVGELEQVAGGVRLLTNLRIMANVKVGQVERTAVEIVNIRW